MENLSVPPLTQVTDWLRTYNAVDLVLVVFFALYALDGVRRGFISGALGLAGTFATLLLSIRAYQPAGAFIGQATGMPPVLANVAGFFVVLVLGQLVISIVLRFVLIALAPVRLLLSPVDHLLGFVPGLVQAVIIAALVLTPLHLFPVVPTVATAIEQSAIAGEITRRVSTLTPQIEALMGSVSEDGELYRSRVLAPDAEVRLPPQTALVPDPVAEAKMLELVNQERTKAGLRPLVADDRITAVARQHSEEMFRLGYFSHTSPNTGSAADRLRRDRVPFLQAGENLAYAPTVEIAHSGLMASPGHRKNILTPEYTRIGIGVISAGLYGRMFTQNFAV